MVIERENLLDENGLIRLAALSDTMERYVTAAKIENDEVCTVCMNEHGTSISLRGEIEVGLTYNFPEHGVEMERINKQDISKWLNANGTLNENVVLVVDKILDLSGNKNNHYFNLFLNLSELRILEILKSEEFQKTPFLTIERDRLGSETISKIYELSETSRMLMFGADFPLDFYHEKALSYDSVSYSDARWVRRENLLQLRNIDHIELGKNNLNDKDINALLRFWRVVNYDMFSSLIIENLDPNFHASNAFRDTGALKLVGCPKFLEPDEGEMRPAKYYLIYSKSKHPKKKMQIASVQVRRFELQILMKPADDFKEHVDILNLIGRHQDKNFELNMIEKELTIVGMDDSQQEDLERSQDLARVELDIIERKLWEQSVTISDGVAKLVVAGAEESESEDGGEEEEEEEDAQDEDEREEEEEFEDDVVKEEEDEHLEKEQVEEDEEEEERITVQRT